jgi:hypothetical protein
MPFTKEQRQDLVNKYINCTLESMDVDDMEIFIADVIDMEMQDYTDDEFVTVVSESYPHLLEE